LFLNIQLNYFSQYLSYT